MFYDELISLKGSHLSMTTLHLKSADLNRIKYTFDQWIKTAPGMFNETMIIADFEKFPEPLSSLFLTELKTALFQRRIFLIGIRNIDPSFIPSATELNIPILTKTSEEKKKRKSKESNCKVYNKKIRSGQQILNPDGHLIITGHVSSTAEVISSHHIFIYGALRGKAIAGAPNRKDAIIICSYFAPELISIAGLYLTAENIPSSKVGKPIQAHYENGKLKLTELHTHQHELQN